MRKYYWRYSRPAGCLLCIFLLLVLAWLIRLLNGPPPTDVSEQVRRTERRSLRPPGETMQVFYEGQSFPFAVTTRDGELYTYLLYPQDLQGSGRNRITSGVNWRDTVSDLPWGCCIGQFSQLELSNGNTVQVQWMYVLVKIPEPDAVAGRLRIKASLGGGDGAYTRTWGADGVRTFDYLRFRIELRGGSESARKLFSAIVNGFGSEETTAAAEVIFLDKEGNEKPMQFDMLRQAEERSEDHGA